MPILAYPHYAGKVPHRTLTLTRYVYESYNVISLSLETKNTVKRLMELRYKSNA
jgi:hypothetical protein